MNVNQRKHTANLAEWKQRIIECCASGQPVKTWCKNNFCNPSTYYRWEREIFGRIRKTTAEDSDTLVGGEALLPAPKHDLVEVQLAGASSNSPLSVVQSTFSPVAVIRIGTMEISLKNSASGNSLSRSRSCFRMLNDAKGFSRIIIACGRTNLRMGIDGLAAIVQEQLQMDSGEKIVLFFFLRNEAGQDQGSHLRRRWILASV